MQSQGLYALVMYHDKDTGSIQSDPPTSQPDSCGVGCASPADGASARDGVTAYGGLPMVVETWYGLGLHKACERHLKLRERQKGLSDAHGSLRMCSVTTSAIFLWRLPNRPGPHCTSQALAQNPRSTRTDDDSGGRWEIIRSSTPIVVRDRTPFSPRMGRR